MKKLSSIKRMTTKRKAHKGGSCLRFEPMDLKLLNEEPNFVEAFRNAGCMRFCQKLQGFYVHISKDFATNFTGTTYKVGMLNFVVAPGIIAQDT